jgi:hypothetical protein
LSHSPENLFNNDGILKPLIGSMPFVPNEADDEDLQTSKI